MLLSFIVIGRNEGSKLDMCFKSIVNFCDINNFNNEIIYVDSQSSDNTEEVLHNWGNIKFLVLDGLCNAARARNLGANYTKGDVLCFVDGDMTLNADFGSRMFVDNKLIHPFINGFRVDYLHDSTWKYLSDNSVLINKNLKNQYKITTGGLFIIEKKLWNELGGIDNRLRAFEDNDLAYRAYVLKGVKLLQIAEVLANHYTINYTNKDRFKKMVFSDYFKYKGVLLRKHLSSYKLWGHFVKRDLTFFVLVFSLLISLVYSYAILLYPLSSICRLFFIKSDSSSTSKVKRLYYNIIIDLKVLFACFFFYPKDYKPVEKTI